jgi:riboflavin kinase/FMN adenylyltransferase
MREIGVEFMLNIKFDSNLVNINAEDFVKKILIEKLKVFYIVTGFDFVFGNQQSGNVKTMKKLAELTKKFFFKEIPEFKFGNNEISSSQIRKNLRNGNLNNANKILSRKWMVISRVIKGEKKAREIGFKTANLKINDYCNLLYGVYFVFVTILDSRIENNFKGIANYGVKPTFKNNEPLLEVHLFNFDEEIYGKKLRIEFVKLVREEKKFESIEKLKDQIINDINTVKNDKLFQNN